MTSPVVTRLLISWPRSTWFSSRKVRSSLAVAAVLDHRAQVLVAVGQGAGEQRQVVGEGPDRRALVDLGLQHDPAVPDQAVVTSKLSFAVSMNALEVSMIWPRSLAASLNAVPSSSMTVRRSSFVDRVDERVEVGEQLVVAIGFSVSSVAISEPSCR